MPLIWNINNTYHMLTQKWRSQGSFYQLYLTPWHPALCPSFCQEQESYKLILISQLYIWLSQKNQNSIKMQEVLFLSFFIKWKYYILESTKNDTWCILLNFNLLEQNNTYITSSISWANNSLRRLFSRLYARNCCWDILTKNN